MKRRLLITGGAGYIGSHTAMLASLAGYQVTVLDNFSRGHREFCRWGDVINADLREPEIIFESLSKGRFDAVIHFAALAYVSESVSNPILYWQNNVGGTANLLSAISKSKIKHMVFSSSCAVYGDHTSSPLREVHDPRPVNPYGQTKLACEQMIADACNSERLTAVILRYFNACGASATDRLYEWHEPETHLIPLAIRAALDPSYTLSVFGTDFPTPDGTAIRDYVHVLDLANAHLLALEYLMEGGKTDCFNLGTGNGKSVAEVISVIEEAARQAVKRNFSSRRVGDPGILVADATKAQKVLGWVPKRDFSDTIQDSIMGFLVKSGELSRLNSSDG